MTFWDFVMKVWPWLEQRITRLIGASAGIVAILDGYQIIPDKQMKYWLAGIGIAALLRGQQTNTVYQKARAVLAANPPTVEQVAVVAAATSGVPPINPPEKEPS